jgi:hypothetical protein
VKSGFAPIVAIALLAASGCGKKSNRYPTISATNPDGGGARIRGEYNFCPVAIFIATPDHARIDQPISITASASDDDNDPLTYAWTASSGSFTSANQAATTFRCSTNEMVTITLKVSDGLCDSTTSGTVLCQPTDAGAQDGNTAGASGQGGSSGQAGTSGQAGSGGSTGAGGGAASSGGMGGSTVSGAGGTTGAAGTTGGGGASGGAGAGGSGACIETTPPAAIAAVCKQCLDDNDNPANDGCCVITDAMGLQLCQAVSACIRSGGATGTTCNIGGDVTSCFCGTNLATCEQTGRPNGPCVAEFTAAARRNVVTMATDSPTAAQVMARQADPSYALGRAANIHGTAGAFCPVECGF